MISRPTNSTAAQFLEQKSKLRTMAIFFTTTYMLRTIMFAIMGHYYLFIPNPFVKALLFLIFSTLLEVPHMFFLYVNHY